MNDSTKRRTDEDQLREQVVAVSQEIEETRNADAWDYLNECLELVAHVKHSSVGVATLDEVEALITYGGPTIRIYARWGGDPEELRIEAHWGGTTMTEYVYHAGIADALREWAESKELET